MQFLHTQSFVSLQAASLYEAAISHGPLNHNYIYPLEEREHLCIILYTQQTFPCKYMSNMQDRCNICVSTHNMQTGTVDEGAFSY